jgi:hypothetical protein
MTVQTMGQRVARVILLAFGATIGISGCRLASCPPPLFSNSNVASQTVVGTPPMIRGRVFSVDSLALLPTSRVRLLSADSTWHDVRADGSFVLRSPGPGALTLEATAPGYEPATGRVIVTADSGATVLAALQRSAASATNAVCGERAIVR